MTTGPTCHRCGSNLITGILESSVDGAEERVCPNCQPDHPLSAAVRESMAKRDPSVVEKMTIEIYGRDLPEHEVWDAVTRFVHETFDADWSVDLRMEAEPLDGVVRPEPCSNCERCTWNPGPDCGRSEHPHCLVCGHCTGRHDFGLEAKERRP